MKVTVVRMAQEEPDKFALRHVVVQPKPLVRVLRYCYTAGGCMDFDLHLLNEVGEPYQPAARAQIAEILAKNPGWEVQTIEIDRKPWLVDALVKIK